MSDVVRRALLEAAEKSRGEDWYDRRLRERREAREKEERERQVQQRQATKSWDAFHRAVDQRVDEWAMTKYNEVIAQFTSEYVAKKTQELRQKDAELEAKVARLERRLDALSQGKREKFQFARSRGDVGEKPTRTVQNFH
jgi:coenzyme F420-reducing hydrogenase alpha subunit